MMDLKVIMTAGVNLASSGRGRLWGGGCRGDRGVKLSNAFIQERAARVNTSSSLTVSLSQRADL